jgi:superfamily II DNA helicase RecQ
MQRTERSSDPCSYAHPPCPRQRARARLAPQRGVERASLAELVDEQRAAILGVAAVAEQSNNVVVPERAEDSDLARDGGSALGRVCRSAEPLDGEAQVQVGVDSSKHSAERAVAELRGRFGAGHVVEVLAGAAGERIVSLQHDRLDAYGSLREARRPELRAWIDQLIGQGFLARTSGEYPTIVLTKHGAAVLRGETAAGPLSRITKPARPARPPAVVPGGAAGGPDDRELFEALRRLRRELAEARGVPPYVVFSDATLREMVRLRPGTREEFLDVKGVGEWKCEEFGARFLAAIAPKLTG